MKYTEYRESSSQLTNSQDILTYIHGGRGILTLEAPSGKSHTYYFTKPRNEEEFYGDIIFVYAKCNEHRRYVGMVSDDVFKMTKSSSFLPDNEITKGAKFIVDMGRSQELVDRTPMKLYHMGVCCKCGRMLTDPVSIRRGIGPKCLKAMNSPFNNYVLDELQCWD